MSKNVVYKSPSNPESGPAYNETVADYSSGGTTTGDNTLQNIPCDSSVYVGAVVRLDGSTIVNAIANSELNSRALGIVTSKSNATTCNVLTCGFTPSGTIVGPTSGQTLFLSSSIAGGITTTPPTAANHVIVYIGRYYNSGIIRLGSLDRIERT